MKPQSNICPFCHQTISVERFGARLPAFKAEILDRIRSSGDVGITTTELIADCYRDRRPVRPTTVKAHVSQINDLLAATSWRIRSDRRRWVLCREARS